MRHILARNWWTVLLRGIAAIAFGAIAFFLPGATIVAIIVVFGIWAFVDGVFAIVGAVRAAESHERWWPYLIEGVIGLVIAAVVFFEPRVAGLALYVTIAAWALLTGVFEIVAAIQLRKAIAGEIFLIIGGILSIVFGILLIAFPIAGIFTVIYLIAAYAVIFGILLISLSLRLRNHQAVA